MPWFSQKIFKSRAQKIFSTSFGNNYCSAGTGFNSIILFLFKSIRALPVVKNSNVVWRNKKYFLFSREARGLLD